MNGHAQDVGQKNPTSWTVGASAELLGLAASGPVVGASIFVGFRPLPWLDLRASAHRTLPSTVVAGPTSTSLTWTTGRITSCVRVLHTGRLEVLPCLYAEIGQTDARGGGVESTERSAHLWGAGGAAGRVELTIAGPLRLEVAAGLFAALDRTEITYRPDFVVYRPPAVGTMASAAALARW